MTKYEPTLCVGVDVHKDPLCFYPLDQQRREVAGAPFTTPNNRPGATAAVHTLTQLLTTAGYTRLLVGMEATGLLWLPFYRTVQQSTQLAPFHPQQTVFNPLLIANFKKGLDLRGDKHDLRDAHAIAERLAFGRLPRTYVPTACWQGLRRLTRYRYRLTQQRTQEKLRFLDVLFLKCSAWTQARPFTDPLGATSAQLLTTFTAGELAQMPLTELTRLIIQYGRNHFADPAATARQVQHALHLSYPVDPDLDEMVTSTLSMMRTHLQHLKQLQQQLDRHITTYLADYPNPLVTVPGLGAVLSAGLWAEIGDITRFPTQAQLAAYAGLTWPRHQSGHFEAEERHLDKRGNVYLRYYFTQGANTMRLHNLEYQAYYQRKRRESAKHAHKRALVLTARKLVRLVHTLLTRNIPYVLPQTYAQQQQEEEA